MQYIIMPVIRFVLMILYYFTMFPLIMLTIILCMLWTFKRHYFKEFFDDVFCYVSFQEELKSYNKNIDTLEVYETCFDWFIRKKSLRRQ